MPTMVTDVQRRKMDREFNLFDHDCDGILARSDYMSVAHKLIETFGISPKSGRGKAVIAAYEALWQRHVRDFDTDGNGRITREEFHAAFEQEVLRENGFNEVYLPLITALVDIVDGDEKDVLNRREFSKLMAVFNVSEVDAMVTFTEVDVDKNDRVTVREFIEVFREFYLGRDARAPANKLFGWI